MTLEDQTEKKAVTAPKRLRRQSLLQVAVSAIRSGSGTWQVGFAQLRKGEPTGRLLAIELTTWTDVSAITRKEARALLSFLGSAEIACFGGDDVLDELDRALAAHDLLPLDNPRIELGELIRGLNEAHGGTLKAFDLATVSMHYGLGMPSDSTDAKAAAHLVARVFSRVQSGGQRAPARDGTDAGNSPEIADLSEVGDLDAEEIEETGAYWPGLPVPASDTESATGPLPDPGLPPAAAMAALARTTPWRTTAWSDDERRECALLFRGGMSLLDLAVRLQRKPTAIHARLVCDGVIAAGPAEEPMPSAYHVSALFA